MSITQKDIDKLQAKAAFYLKRWRSYPLGWVVECLGAREREQMPVRWQVDALNNLRDHNLVAIRSGHGVGKTRYLALAFWWIMTCWKTPGFPLKIPCTGPSGGNLEDILWPELGIVHKQLPPYLRDQFVVTSDHIKRVGDIDAWFGALRTARADNPVALQGFHGEPMFSIIDEAPGVHDDVFETGSGAFSGKLTYSTMTGNPTNLSGMFYEIFKHPTGLWKLMHVDCRDELDDKLQKYNYVDPYGKEHLIEVAGRVSPGYITHIYSTYGEHGPEADVRVRGEFPKTSSISTVRIRNLSDSEWLEPHAKRIMGVDPADLGNDATAMVIRKGKNIEDAEEMRNALAPDVAKRVREKYFEAQKLGQQIDVINVDCTGVGAGTFGALTDRKGEDNRKFQAEIKAKRVRVGRLMVQASSPPDDSGTACYRLRDWLWWQVRLYFQRYAPHFVDHTGPFETLQRELVGPHYSYNGKGEVKVESKKEMIKRMKHSPNLADALCYTFFGDSTKLAKGEKKKEDPHRKQRRRNAIKEQGASWRTV